jgi:lactobin A/cerein 7B family class IIb bacteriocin
MSDSQKGNDSSSNESPKTEESSKELTADDLESVSGGVLPGGVTLVDKHIKGEGGVIIGKITI